MQLINSESLRAFVNYLTIKGAVKNDADFASQMGRNRSGMSEVLNGKKKVSLKLAADVMEKFPEAREFFELGYVSEQNGEQKSAVDPVVSELHSIIKKQQEQIDRLLSIIENKLG